MEEFQAEKYEDQPDLFDASGPETRSDRLKSFFRFRRESSVAVSLELLTLALVVMMILLIAAFYLGFLRGKSVQRLEISKKIQVLRTQQAQAPVEAGHMAPSQAPPIVSRLATREEPKRELKELPPRKSIEKPPQKPYTIQVIAYRNEARALTEVSRLKRKGYSARIIAKGGFYLITVGEYAHRAEADKDLAALKRAYSDSFLRKF